MDRDWTFHCHHRRERCRQLCGTLLLLLVAVAGQAEVEPVLDVWVSIPPQLHFVQRIGGERVHASCLLPPGQNPHAFEPSARQIAGLADADLFMAIGVPYEQPLLERIAGLSDSLTIVATQRDIRLRQVEGGCPGEAGDHDHAGHSHAAGDPHIWLSPRLVALQADTMAQAMAAADPAGATTYQRNLEEFQKELETLDADLALMLARVKVRKILVYHPAWGYFTDAYGLEQVPIEAGGREPGARHLAAIIDQARKEDIHVVIVQQQFDTRMAQALADDLGARVLGLDVLAADWEENLRTVAAAIAETSR